MKNKLVVLSCAVSVLFSAASLAASLAARARAAESESGSVGGLTVVAEDHETRVYSFQSGGHQCFLASTRGGSGVSLQCPH